MFFIPLKIVKESRDSTMLYGDMALRLAANNTIASLEDAAREYEVDHTLDLLRISQRKKFHLLVSLGVACALLIVAIVAPPASTTLLGSAILAISGLTLWYGLIDSVGNQIMNQASFARDAFALARAIRQTIDGEVRKATRQSSVVILPPPMLVGTPPSSDCL